MGTDNPANQLDNTDDQHIQSSHAGQDSGNRLRHALANLGLFFEAACERDPIPSLQEIASELLQTDEINHRNYLNMFPSAHFTYDLPKENMIQLSYSRRFDVPGRYTYFCIPHEAAGMIGEITVEPR